MRLLWKSALICLWLGIVAGSVSTTDRSEDLLLKDTTKSTRIQRNLIPCFSTTRGYGWCSDRLFSIKPLHGYVQDPVIGATVSPPQVILSDRQVISNGIISPPSNQYSYPDINFPYKPLVYPYSNPPRIVADQILIIVSPTEKVPKVETSSPLSPNITSTNATSQPTEVSPDNNSTAQQIEVSKDTPKNYSSADYTSDTSTPKSMLSDVLNKTKNIAEADDLDERSNVNTTSEDLNRRKREVDTQSSITNEINTSDDITHREINYDVITIPKNELYDVMEDGFNKGPKGDDAFLAFIDKADDLVKSGVEPFNVIKDVISNLFILASKTIQSESTERGKNWVKFNQLYDVLDDVFKSNFSERDLEAYFEKLEEFKRMGVDRVNLGFDVAADLFLIVARQKKISKKEKKAIAAKAVHILLDSVVRLET